MNRSRRTIEPAAGIRALVFGVSLLSLAGAAAPDAGAQACRSEKKPLRLGFYAYFEPVSYSADRDPASPGFDVHLGFEADLLTALEAIEGANLSFSRRGVAAWDGIWLLPSGPRYDIVGGGITILDSRTYDAAGTRAIVFTGGHIGFRQSLLVRAADAGRMARHRDLTGRDRVGVLAGTTGEARLLELTGIVDAAGVLADGTLVETPGGVVVADGGTDYVVGAAGASARLQSRRRLEPASAAMPQVVYLADEEALIKALAAWRIDAVARGEIGNRATARASGGAFAVAAVDPQHESGGFALAATDAGLAACLDRHIASLTDGGRIGFKEWLDDPSVFLRRARQRPGSE